MGGKVVAGAHLAIQAIRLPVALGAVAQPLLAPPSQRPAPVDRLHERCVAHVAHLHGKGAAGLNVSLGRYAERAESGRAHQFVRLGLQYGHFAVADIIRKVPVAQHHFQLLMPEAQAGGRAAVTVDGVGDVKVELRQCAILTGNFLHRGVCLYIGLHDAALEHHRQGKLAAPLYEGQGAVMRAQHTSDGIVHFRTSL